MRWRDLHKYLSYFILILCIYGVASGIKSQNRIFGSGPTNLYVGVIIFFIGVWAIMEGCHQYYIR